MAVAARAAAVRTAAPIESLAAPVRIIGLGLDERVEQLSLPVSSTTSTYTNERDPWLSNVIYQFGCG